MIIGIAAITTYQGRQSYLDHLFDTLKSIFTHLHDMILYGTLMWHVKWLGAHVYVVQKVMEFGPFNLLEWLVTGNNLFYYISLKSLMVKCFYLVILSVKDKDEGQNFDHCILL